MSTGIDIQFVRENYQRMADDELIRIATQDAQGLTPEAIEVVKEEIKKRGLNENIVNGVEAQNKTTYTIEEIDAYCDIISKLRCPSCGSTTERVNATAVGEVVSAVFITRYDRKIKVGCPRCLDKANRDGLVKSLIRGWWAIPWGIVHTVRSIILNISGRSNNHSPEHTEHLRDFVLANIGELAAYKNDREKLQEIIGRPVYT